MNCLIIDDNEKSALHLQQLLEETSSIETVHVAFQPYRVRALMETGNIEVVFVRPRLWDHEQFSSMGQNPVMVFLSGGRDKITNREETGVRYVLREPYNSIDISILMKRVAQEKYTETPDYLFLRYDRRFHKTRFADIQLIERKQGSYMHLFLTHGDWFVPGPITTWMARLPKELFIRVSDTLILPVAEANKIKGTVYSFQGREIPLTFRFAIAAKSELEKMSDWLLNN